MGIFGKLAFWKKDDFDDFGSGKGMDDPLRDIGKDPLADLGKDPFSDSNNFSHGSHEPQFDPMTGQRTSGMVNDIGMGTNQDSNPYDHVKPMATRDPFSSDSRNESPPFSSSSSSSSSKDLEIISAKIDTVRVSVENLGHRIDQLNQRLAVIESIAKDEQNNEIPKW